MWGRLAKPITLGVRVMLVRDGEVLLIEHTYRSGWYFPGGGVKREESLAAAARREAREEVGAEVREMRLLGVYSGHGRTGTDHVAVFVSEAFELVGGIDPGEVSRAQWFPFDALPEGTPRGTMQRIAEYREGVQGGFTQP